MKWFGKTEGPGAGEGWRPRLGGFLLFSLAGLASLAAAVLLPEYALLVDLTRQRDDLAHQIRCEERLSVYNERVIQAAQSDPVFVARLMARQENYRPVGCQVREVPTALHLESVPERLLRESLNPPPPPPDVLADAGRWIDEPGIKGGLVLLGLGLLAVAIILFGRLGLPVSPPPAPVPADSPAPAPPPSES